MKFNFIIRFAFLIFGFSNLVLSDFVLAENDSQNNLKRLNDAFLKSQSDSEKIVLLLSLSEEYAYFKPDTVIVICNTVLKKIESCNKTFKNKEYFLEAQSAAYNNIGYIHSFTGNIPLAIEYYTKSLKIEERLNKQNEVALALNNIGFIYQEQGEWNLAHGYYEKAYAIQQKNADTINIGVTLNNLGSLCAAKKDYTNALKYFNQSYEHAKKFSLTQDLAIATGNIGNVYNNMEQREKALPYFLEGLKLDSIHNDYRNMSNNLLGIATIYLHKNDLNKALAYAQKGLKLASEMGFLDQIKLSAMHLFDIYSRQKDFKRALEMHVLYKSMSDSISNQENQRASIQQHFKYQYEKKASADSLKNQQERLIEQTQIESQKQLGYVLIVGLIFAIACGLFIFNRYRLTRKLNSEIQKQKKLIEEKQTEIIDSIKSAERIQKSIMTQESYIARKLNFRKLKD